MIRETKVNTLDGEVDVELYDPESDRTVGKVTVDWVPEAARMLITAEGMPFDDPDEVTVELTTERVHRLIVNGHTGLEPSQPNGDTLHKMRVLSTLGELEVTLMHPSVWEQNKLLSMRVRYLDIVGGNGLLTTGVSASGCDLDEIVDELFEKLTNLEPGYYLVSRWPGRRAFRWDAELGAFAFVEEPAHHG